MDKPDPEMVKLVEQETAGVWLALKMIGGVLTFWVLCVVARLMGRDPIKDRSGPSR